MAAIQVIRKHGAVLASIVGIALFAFVAEEAVRSCSSSANEERQQIGSVCGKKLSYQDYQAMVAEYEEVYMMMRQVSSLSEEEHASLRDQVWQQFVAETSIKNECDQLGLTVTDAEMQHAITTGTNPLLRQTPFTNPQTGQFDAQQLKQFLDAYEQAKNDPAQSQIMEQQYEPLHKYWTFIEKQLRSQILTSKYQALLASLMMSNKVSAKASFEDRTAQSSVLLAALPYSSLKDTEVSVAESDIKAKYDELKEQFYSDAEMRDVEIIDVAVKASEADKAALMTEMQEAATALATTNNMTKTIREVKSLVNYSTLPVKKTALPADVAMRIDSMAVGAQTEVYTNNADNTMNVVRLIAKTSCPDSVEVRQIQVANADQVKARATADSIMLAIKAGAEFDSIAARYNQQGEKSWVIGRMYEGATMDDANAKLFRAITGNATGSLEVIDLEGGCIVLNVTDRRDFQTKYDVAVVKREITFSKETYTKAYNDFSSFLAANLTADSIRANAVKNGYTLQPQQVTSTDHYVAYVHSTRDALRWIFNEETKKDAVSQLYECGDNDHLLVAILTDITPKGYIAVGSSRIEPFLNAEAIKDKKAAKFAEQMQGKTAAQVGAMKGAVSDTLTHVTFANPVFVSSTGARESVLCGAIAGLAKGKSSAAVKGNGGVYVATVLDTQKAADKFDAKTEMQTASSKMMNNLRMLTAELQQKANVVDHRYLFY